MPLVEITDIHKSFGLVEVLKGVSLTLEKGEIAAVIGRSGSGKSTMLRCVNGLERVQSGRIVVDGLEVTAPATDLNVLRQRVGMVFQSYNLFPHLNVERNVMLALRKVRRMADAEARDIARAMVAKVGLADKLAAYPDELSGGQQQRVAIARSLAMQPTIMLFDEITSALDPELVGEVLKVLEELAREGMTMMLVTHEMNFAKNVADRVIFMHQGNVHEDGPARETLLEPRTPELGSFLSAVLH
ncbi:MAG: amino acid ABC transporter ATP-binding protein [Devosia sp.]|jgi:polar amino acid transport system ATP-binding protein|uniref:amino acid ABC transporter ATP-binding protein n=1 Tax=unclassified Devosia TaxID=196773 RepID=UPI00092ADFDC|nr:MULTISPECIES: amino acid ABC transporter ATP-binding protein [unclassified Devosia]MBL8597355.1 amino acid ABC transporter ATP-binding protein [Devosia sp.]MBN9346419.1 amino acid ABC transporter ATP-binding protein [Devosia sp.]OJX48547.1 MAG: amino acid ABC transporter ATP-binding protein [Devosia sp. 66-22]